MPRHVIPSRQVYHLWAHQAQYEAYNARRSVSFRGAHAYSYAAVIARLVENARGETAALFSTDRWSVTTARHQSMCRAAASHLRVFRVPRLGEDWPAAGQFQVRGSEVHAANLRSYKERIQALIESAGRARTHRMMYQADALALQSEATSYCRFFDLAEEFTDAAVQQALEDFERAREAYDRQQAERHAAWAAEQRASMADAVRRWMAGEWVPSLPDHPDTFLRLRPGHPDDVETSRGAHVPLAAARRLFARWSASEPIQGEPIGAFTVNEATAERIVIGCHTFAPAEIRRFFTTLTEEGSAHAA